MSKALTQELLDAIVTGAVRKKHIHGFVMNVRLGQATYTSAAGDLDVSSRFFIASVTKLFVTAAVLQLEAEGRLSLEDSIAKHLPRTIVQGLHVLKEIDRSASIELWHLMSNTSGIPDYFDKETIHRLISNQDEAWGLEPTLAAAKRKRPRFLPGAKAQYSDTNYQLLGTILETVTGQSISRVFNERVITPLDLADTYLYQGEPDNRLAAFYYKSHRLDLPRYMASIGAEGGIVSTAQDLGTFTQGFFNGRLFDKRHLERLYKWRLMFAPGVFYYGIGVARQPLSLFKMQAGLLGHWGQSGAFAFFHPASGVSLCGTANQFTGQGQAARALLKVLRHPMT